MSKNLSGVLFFCDFFVFPKNLKELLENLKDNGVPSGMTDEAYFDVIIDLEDAIDKATEGEE